jgi:hypothetical protein
MQIPGLGQQWQAGGARAPRSVADAIRAAVQQHADHTGGLHGLLSRFAPGGALPSNVGPLLGAHANAANSLSGILSAAAKAGPALTAPHDPSAGGIVGRVASM